MSLVDDIVGWLLEARQVVAFTGAGVSTESGIPDYRSPQGVWANNRQVQFHEYLSSAEARNEYWRQKCISHVEFHAAQPNATHRILSAWENSGLLRAVVTQNIDGLHQLAGSRRVLELHGTAREVSCLSCFHRWDAAPWVEAFRASGSAPQCPDCGGHLKHATISFGQSLPEQVLEESIQLAQDCDVMLSLGSSLVVHPAAGIPELARRSGARLVIINRDPTPLDKLADAVLRTGLGDTMQQLADGWQAARSGGRGG